MNEKVKAAIYSAIDEINKQLPNENRLDKSLDTVVIGPESKIDSLGIVNLIVTIEENIEENCAIAISLTEDTTIFAEDNQSQTVASLCEEIGKMLESTLQ